MSHGKILFELYRHPGVLRFFFLERYDAEFCRKFVETDPLHRRKMFRGRELVSFAVFHGLRRGDVTFSAKYRSGTGKFLLGAPGEQTLF